MVKTMRRGATRTRVGDHQPDQDRDRMRRWGGERQERREEEKEKGRGREETHDVVEEGDDHGLAGALDRVAISVIGANRVVGENRPVP